MRTLCAIVIGLSILLMPCAVPSRAQTDHTTLPADLLFTGLTYEGSPWNFTTLMRVDAQTLQLSPFYVDDSSYIRPLDWSPSGNLLAVLRYPLNADYIELCLLTREGSLQTCFDDKIVRRLFLERGQDYMVTWSDDERYLYFVTDYGQYRSSEYDTVESWGSRLVEADVTTGQTQRIIYQTPLAVMGLSPEIYWTEDLHYLLVDFYRIWITVDLRQNTEFILPRAVSFMGEYIYCDQFSPLNHYLTARSYDDNGLSGLALVSPEGQIVQKVRPEQVQEAGIEWMRCPVWQSDEEAFYFLGGMEPNEARLFKYVLAEDLIIPIRSLYPYDPYDPPFPDGFPQMPMRLGPDSETLAITFRIYGATEIRILSPTNEWVIYGSEALRPEEHLLPIGYYPLWFPADN